MNNKIIVICGPTASGKSAYAMKLADKLNGIILNGDSMQVYKDFPILTAQPSKEDMSLVPHEFYGFLPYDAHFSVGKWLELITPRINDILASAKAPIIVGGSGLYLKSLIEGFVQIPELSEKTIQFILDLDNNLTNQEIHSILEKYDLILYNKLKSNDRKRSLRAIAVAHETGFPLSWWQRNKQKKFFNRQEFYIICINPKRDIIYQNCNQRFYNMIEMGVENEIRTLIKKHPNERYPEIIGLKELISYIKGESLFEDMVKKAQQMTRNYAKRQITWFKHQMDYDIINTN